MSSAAPLSVSRCFIDTSAYFALTDASDGKHHESLSIVGWLADQHIRLFTTNFILAETHALILSRVGSDIARRVLFDIDRSSTTIVRVSQRDEQHAREILTRYTDKSFSLTDATSFAVMERLRIRHAFSFDDDFSQYGLTVLTPAFLS